MNVQERIATAFLVIAGVTVLTSACETQDVGTIDQFIRQLGSPSVDDRGMADAALRKIGPSALKSLAVAARSDDLDIAARADRLGKLIEADSILGPRIPKVIPDAAERVAFGPDHAWTLLFLDLASQTGANPQETAMLPADLEAITPRAVRGATVRELSGVCEGLVQGRAEGAAAGLRPLLRREEPAVLAAAAYALSALGDRASVEPLGALLRSGDETVRAAAARALGRLDAREWASSLEFLLEQKDCPLAQSGALEALEQLGALSAVPRIRPLVKSTTDYLAAQAVGTLGRLKAVEALEDLVPILDNSRGYLRICAIDALGILGREDAVPPLSKILAESEDNRERRSAAVALCRLGWKKAAGVLVDESIKMSDEVPASIPTGAHLTSLNAIRNRAAWGRLWDQPLQGRHSGGARAVFERLARAAALRVDWSALSPEVLKAYEGGWVDVWNKPGRRSMAEGLSAILPAGAEFILEDDVLRVVPKSEALAFWRSWNGTPKDK